MEPMSWALWQMSQGAHRRPLPRARDPAPADLAAQLVSFLDPYDALAHPGARRAPAADRDARHRRRRPAGDLPPLRLLHAVHADLQRHRSARRLAAAVPRRRRPPARRPARRPPGRRGRPARAGRPARGRPTLGRRAGHPPSPRRPPGSTPLPSTARADRPPAARRARRGRRPSAAGDAEALRVGGPARRGHRHLEQLGLVPGREAPGSWPARSSARSAARDDRRRDVDEQAAGGRAAASARRDDRLVA